MSDIISSYFYIIYNNDWNYENKCKYGYTTDPYNRHLSEQHSYKSYYHKLYKIEETSEYNLIFKQYDKIISHIGRYNKEYNINLEYLNEIHKYLVNHDGSTEFIYKNGLDLLINILTIEFPILGLNITEVNVNDINKIIKEHNNKPVILDNIYKVKPNIIIKRDYQTKIISECFDLIIKNNKVYLELATGAGKSVYMLRKK